MACSCSSGTGSGVRNIWRDEEIAILLEVFRQHNINKMFDGKKYKNHKIYKFVQSEIHKRGIMNKTADQIKNKWKALKASYYKCRRENNVSGAERKECDFYVELEGILGSRLSANLTGIDAIEIIEPRQPTEDPIRIEIKVDPTITHREMGELASPVESVASTASTETDESVNSPRSCGTRKRKLQAREDSDEQFFRRQQQMMETFFQRQQEAEERSAERRRQQFTQIMESFTQAIHSLVATPPYVPTMMPPRPTPRTKRRKSK